MRSFPRVVAASVVAIGLVAPLLVSAQTIPVAVPNVPTAATTVSSAKLPVGVAPSGSLQVNEAPAAPLAPAPHTVAGWKGLWDELAKSNVDVRVALAEIERAEAATRIAWGAVLPTINGTVSLQHNGSANPTSLVGAGNFMQASLSIAQPLINLRSFHAIETSRELEDIARLSALDVHRRIGAGLARAAVSIASAQRLAELNRVSLQLSIDRLDLTKKRLAAGVGDVRDLVRSQQDVASTRANIAPADEQVVQAREALAQLLGQSGQLGIAEDPEALETEVEAFCGSAKEPTDRVDVLIAKKNIDIAERNVDDIVLKFFPTLTASASVSESGNAFGGPFVAGWSVSGVLTIPFYDGGVRYGELRDRRALVEEARAHEVQTEVGAMIERAQARRAIDVAVAAQVSAREARDLAAEADRLARLAYAAGVGTNFDLIDAGRTLRSAETTLLLRDLDVAEARINLPFIEGRCDGVAPK